MGEDEKLLTPSIVEAEKRKGKSQSQIAREWGVTRQRVSQVKLSTGGYSQTPREAAMENYPWEVPAQFQRSSIDKRMRDHAEYMATLGKGMEQWKLDRLASFYDYLESEDAVIEFDPEIPPNDYNTPGGFAYRKRERSDGKLIIRVNEHTELTDLGRRIWVMPKRRPQS